MGIKLMTKDSDIVLQLEKQQKRMIDQIVTNLEYVGEACIKEARDNGSYHDQTGNLRSSIGYVVVDDGRIVSTGLNTDVKAEDGRKRAENYLKELASKSESGKISLIVCAGMNYAAHVEANGYNVLTSAELLAEQLVPSMMKQLGFTVNR